MEPVQQQEVLDAYKRLFDTEEYSDLTIVSRTKRYRVHKAIVCPRSPFFASACNGLFKESQTGDIEFPEDDPQAVEMMVYYLYHFDYRHVFPGPVTPPIDEPAPVPEEAHVQDGGIPPVDEPLPVDEPAPVPEEAHIESFWVRREKKKKKTELSTRHLFVPNLAIHATVYALAEKYALPGLKDLSLRKFRNETERHWQTDDFLDAARLAYTSTVEDDRGLRDIVVEVFHRRRFDLMAREEARKTVYDTQCLAYDMILACIKEDCIKEDGFSY